MLKTIRDKNLPFAQYPYTNILSIWFKETCKYSILHSKFHCPSLLACHPLKWILVLPAIMQLVCDPALSLSCTHTRYIYLYGSDFFRCTSLPTNCAQSVNKMASIGTWSFSLPATKLCVSHLKQKNSVVESIVKSVSGIWTHFQFIFVDCRCRISLDRFITSLFADS